MDGSGTADISDLVGSSIVPETCENPDPVNSPSSSEQEVNNEMSLDTDFEQTVDTQEHIGEIVTDEDKVQETMPEKLENGDCNSNGSDLDKSKVSCKNVSFPEETLVMGFLEPPDPWKNAPRWKTEDLMKAYKLSCEKHGTKPLNKIMQQLQCIENVGERYEILSLKGERMDLRQCESLEEIFKRVRFRCIDLEGTHLDDEMAVAIFEMVEYYESACKLNISFNKSIGPRGWQACARLVRKTPCLTFIDARNCDINERMIPILGRSLRMGCYLTRLQLQNVNLAGRALVILVAALKMNEILKELFIGDNKLMPTDGIQIGNLLKFNHKLELLDLRNNHLQDVGASHLFDGLAEQNLDTGLLTLVLWNNQITFQAMAAVNKGLTTAANLETLNLGHNPITNEGIHVLKDGLLKSRSLLKLGMSGTKITCEGAVALAEFIADSHKLVRLDLQENDIKTAGLMALSLALKMNHSLTRLELDRDTKKESGVKDYVQQQKRLLQEITTLLDRNRDLAHKQDEERRLLEQQNKENAKNLEEAAKDIVGSESTAEYIPPEDTIHRPKLLFIPQVTPQRELDSPKCGEFTETSNPFFPAHLTLGATGAELLSPQYCPNPKATAKKLFSVTRVLSPTMPSNVSEPSSMVSSSIAPVDILNSPTSMPVPQLCSPLPELPGLIPQSLSLSTELSPASPNTMQRVIEEHTLVSYIQQIISDSTNQVTTSTDISESNAIKSENEVCGVDNNLDSGKDESVTGAKEFYSNPNMCNMNIVSTESGVTLDSGDCGGVDLKSKVGVDECSERNQNNSGNVAGDDTNTDADAISQAGSKDCDINSDIPENETTQTEVVESVPLTANVDETEDIDNDISKDTSYSLNDDDSVSVASHVGGPEDPIAESKNDKEFNSDFVDCVTGNCVSEASGDVDVGDTQEREALSGINVSDEQQASAGVEQWNTVTKLDIPEDDTEQPVEISSDDNGNTRKPDFHTNLSLNGLKQELASLIDEEGNPTTFAEKQSEIEATGKDENKPNGDLATDWIDATSSLDVTSS